MNYLTPSSKPEPSAVACPHGPCSAAAGAPCVTPKGRLRAPHQCRVYEAVERDVQAAWQASLTAQERDLLATRGDVNHLLGTLQDLVHLVENQPPGFRITKPGQQYKEEKQACLACHVIQPPRTAGAGVHLDFCPVPGAWRLVREVIEHVLAWGEVGPDYFKIASQVRAAAAAATREESP